MMRIYKIDARGLTFDEDENQLQPKGNPKDSSVSEVDTQTLIFSA